jgi:hypothetical protein
MSIIASLVAAGALAVPLHADIRYTTRVQVRETQATESQAATPSSPVLGMLRKQMVDLIAPRGSTQIHVAANADAVRLEFPEGTAAIPKGGVLLIRTDGTSVVLDPTTRTYWKVTRGQSRAQSLLSFEVPPVRTGETKRISGARAERVTFNGRLDLKLSDKPLPPDLVKDLRLEGEVWVTDRIRVPTGVTDIASPALRALGLQTIVGDGFVVRQVLRGPLLGNQEIETIVVDIDSKKIAPDQMRIPDTYKQVEPPTAR